MNWKKKNLLLCLTVLIFIFLFVNTYAANQDVVDTIIINAITNKSIFKYTPSSISAVFPDTLKVNKKNNFQYKASSKKYSVDADFEKDETDSLRVTFLLITFTITDTMVLQEYYNKITKKTGFEACESKYPNGKYYTWMLSETTHTTVVSFREKNGQHSVRLSITNQTAEY